MELVICARDISKQDLLARDLNSNALIHWIEKPQEFMDHLKADAFIDLEFELTDERIGLIKRLQPRAVIVNSVIKTLDVLPQGTTRINGWNGFLKRPVIEASAKDEQRKIVAEIFSHFNRQVEWIPDKPGFISARVISMIINEAYFALEERLSSREEIDTAMKLGTNYPFGPFEWSRIIGLDKIYELLNELSKTEKRYKPAPLLQQEALHGN